MSTKSSFKQIQCTTSGDHKETSMEHYKTFHSHVILDETVIISTWLPNPFFIIMQKCTIATLNFLEAELFG